MKNASLFKPEITQYQSYRRLLEDWYCAEKSQSKGTTLATFAKNLGLSASAFSMILSGERDLTIHSFHRLAHAFRLSDQETEWLETLILRDQAKTSHERAHYSRRLARLSADRPASNRVRTSSKRIVAHWSLPALLVYLIDFLNIADQGVSALATLTPEQERELLKKLEIPHEELRNLLAVLEKTGLLKIHSKERVHIVFGKVSDALADKRFLSDVLRIAARRLEASFGQPNHSFTAHTLTIDEERIPQLISEFKALMDRQISEAPVSDRKRIVQTSFQLFPVV